MLLQKKIKEKIRQILDTTESNIVARISMYFMDMHYKHKKLHIHPLAIHKNTRIREIMVRTSEQFFS
jgi:PIN domain nuclease of toxin-antitoxin system